MRITIQLKTRWYMALAMPSRTASATAGETGETIQSDPALMRRVESAFVSPSASHLSFVAISRTT